jgi:predicted amidophosphoribosyltransferase
MAGWGPFRRANSAGGDVQRRTASPKALKRERHLLLREREERIRDLGGLVFEMFRRDRFRVELVTQRCSELLALEERLNEVTALISSAGGHTTVRCECGAPVARGTHFCANCGRPVGPRPVVSCARCGSPLPANVQFCGHCGSPVDSGQPELPADTQPEPAPKEPAEA